MKRTYEVQFEVGQQVNWNFFGQPEGSRDKSGVARVVMITIHQFRQEHAVTYDLEPLGTNQLILEVPSSCITYSQECLAV